jgi:hypothetical protein
MTKLIRGKVIIESDTLDEPQSDPIFDEEDNTPLEGSMVVLNDVMELISGHDGFTLIPERSGDLFASIAPPPWAGAEKTWRQGVTAPSRGTPQLAGRGNKKEKELPLTEEDFATVLSSFPPSLKPTSSGRIVLTRLLSYALVASIAVVITWMVIGVGDGGEMPAVLATSPVDGAVMPTNPSAGTPVCDREEKGDKSLGKGEAKNRWIVAGEPSTMSAKRARGGGDSKHRSTRVKRRVRHHRRIPDPPAVAATDMTDRVSVRELLKEAEDRTAPPDSRASMRTEAVEMPAGKTSAETTAPEDEIAKEAHALQATAVDVTQHESEDEGRSAYGEKSSLDVSSSTLSEESIRHTMANIAPEVRKCRKHISGRVLVELVISGETGRVISAKAVDQGEVGATAGRCAARAVALAKFPKFDRSRLTIRYPFDI